MKISPPFGLTAMVLASIFATVARSQSIPIETESLRHPSFQTGGNVLIRNAHVMTVTKGELDHADVLVLNGKIAAIGPQLSAPASVKVVDASGKYLTPGLVDAHSHRGEDTDNEYADSISPEVRVADVLNPNQLNLYYALTSGITTGMLLHGSANPIGGESLVIKHKWMRPASEVAFPGAPRMVKFALGENPTHGGGGGPDSRFPVSRMGMAQVYERAFADAQDYIKRWDEYEKHRQDPKIAPPRFDLRLEALADVLRGKMRVQCHSYRQDEMLMMVRLSQKYGFNLTLQHALESYKIAPELRAANVPVSIFSDGFAYKLEVVDSTPMASTILDKAGVLVSLNTDTFGGPVPLAMDAGKAIRYGTSPDHALRMITINPAMELGIEKRVGSIEVGKDGDLAIWDGYPLSTYAKCSMTLIEGEPYFERRDAFKVDARSSIALPPLGMPFPLSGSPLPAPGRRYAIVDATIHPVSGPEMHHASLLLADGKIVAVGEHLAIPAGTVRLDAKNLQVWPGLIDAGSQLGLFEFGEVGQASDTNEHGNFEPDLRAVVAVNPESQHFAKVRYNGITSAVVYPSAGLIGGQAGLVRTLPTTSEGTVVQDRIGLEVTVPEALSIEAREGMKPDDITKSDKAVHDARRKLREYFEAAKRYSDLHSADPSLPTDIKLEQMAAYAQGKQNVFFNVNSEEGCRYVALLSKSLGLKAVIVGGSDAWKVAKTLREGNIPVIVSPPSGACPNENFISGFDPYDTPFASTTMLADARVRVAFASHSSDMAMDLPYQVGQLCAYGLTHDDAMRGLTLDAAKILGVDKTLGSLEAGKVANFFVSDGDPLEVSTHLRYLFIEGKPVALESKYTDLYRKYMGRISPR